MTPVLEAPSVAAPPFRTVLVANRGEIARRIIRTLRRLGIRSIAVYSDADASAPHVLEADDAVRIGPAPAADSYLRSDAIIAAAVATGAQAIHPGYGFLSENAEFAAACSAAGIVFVGPDTRALEIMGDKIRAKQHVEASGVPVIAGVSDPTLDDAGLVAAASTVGYPLLVKPSAGGGGKGMQVVRDAEALPAALVAARRIARAAFGDDTLLLERLIERPRHIEVQVLADAHGAVIHLGERECTLQRRHQKVIEEAPSPFIDNATRARLGKAACAAARSVDYCGVGTVEFLVAAAAPEEFSFIEMNTRLQVEHPVTEMVTGVDLVEQQLRVAAGLPLGISQEDVRIDGHAIEARVYAESPERGFLPATGRVLVWHEPRGAGVRVDAAVQTGSKITAHYDPMIAKVIAHGADRAEALARLDRALADTVILGLDTNIHFLRTLLAEPAVQAGELDTGLIERMPDLELRTSAPQLVLEAAAFVAAVGEGAARPQGSFATRTPGASAPWTNGDGWRIGRSQPRSFAFSAGAGDPVLALPVETDAIVAWDGQRTFWVHADGEAYELHLWTRSEVLHRNLAAINLGAIDRGGAASSPEARAPMPGTVVAVHVADGDDVVAGAPLVTIEAMKMEHPALAPHAGIVHLHAAVGDLVSRDQVLAHVVPHGIPTQEQ